MDFYFKIFDVFMLCAGAYMLYAGWSGKGSLYERENLKEGKQEAYRLLIKWFCLIGGPLAVVTGVLDFIKLEPLNNILFTVFALTVLAVVVGTIRLSGKAER